MSSGRIVEIIGAVIDVEFNREDVPKVYDALTVNQNGLTLEVQQQLGDGIVRTIAMGVSDGLSRGLEVTNTGAPISIHIGLMVPVCSEWYVSVSFFCNLGSEFVTATRVLYMF